MSERQALVEQLERHEGLRLFPYSDTVGKITIGCGRNLTDVGISEDEARMLLDHDLDACIEDLATFPWFPTLDPVRQRALVDMRFNLGPSRFREFKMMLAAVAGGDYEQAGKRVLMSKYATQVKTRARTIARMLATGLALLFAAASASAQPIPGCVNGRLEDPKAWFFALIQRAEGQASTNWPAVLTASGIPAAPGLPYTPDYNNGAYGITQQISNEGPRGVLTIPTAVADSGGWRTKQILVVVDAWPDTSRGTWQWIDRFPDGRPYVPGVCGPPPAPVPNPGPIPPSPPSDLSMILYKLDTLTGKVDAGFVASAREHIDITAAVNRPGWVMRILENKYVQMGLVALYAVVETKVGAIGKLFD